MKPVHSEKLERWLGTERVEHISRMFKDWYGAPVPVARVPGDVYVAPGGDFVGEIDGGGFMSMYEYAFDRSREAAKRLLEQKNKLGVGFSSLEDLLFEIRNGKIVTLPFDKMFRGTTAYAVSSWNLGSHPVAGGVGGTSGTGRVCNNSTTGAMKFVRPVDTDLAFLAGWKIAANVAIATVLLSDRLWDTTHNFATSTSTAVDSANRPNRYQTANGSMSNFLSGEITTAVGVTAFNLSFTYVDQDGNTAETTTPQVVAAGLAINNVIAPSATGKWFHTLNSPDVGLRYITNITQSTITSITGVANMFIAHPLAIIPCSGATAAPFNSVDGIISSFNMVKIDSEACLQTLTPYLSSNTNAIGTLNIVSG